MATPHLRGRISLDDSPFMGALRRTRGAGQAWASSMASGLRSPVARISGLLGGAFSVSAFTGGIKGALDLGSELHNLSKSTGVAVGQLYDLQGAFAESDMGAAEMATSLARMQKAIAGGADKFKGIDISLKSLKNLSPAEQFQQIGSAILTIDDPAKRAAAAMQIFGKSGASLLPVLEDVQKMDFSRLSAAGAAMEKNAARFDEAGDAATRAQRAFKGMYIGIAAGILKGGMDGAGALEKVDWIGKGQTIGKDLAKGISAIVGAVNLLSDPNAQGKDVSDAKELGSNIASKVGQAAKSKLYQDFKDIGTIASKLLPKSLQNLLGGAGSKVMASAGLTPGPPPLLKRPDEDAPEMPVETTSGSGWGRLETFKSFREPDNLGNDESRQRSERFDNFFGFGGNKPNLGEIGSQAVVKGGGLERMNKAYDQKFINKEAEARSNLKEQGKEDPTLKAILAEVQKMTGDSE